MGNNPEREALREKASKLNLPFERDQRGGGEKREARGKIGEYDKVLLREPVAIISKRRVSGFQGGGGK